MSTTYKDAGVDIDAGEELVRRIKEPVKQTRRPEVIGGLGGFGALTRIPQKYKKPILVSGTDGVGTKLKLAIDLNRHDNIGIDLVAMCVNDLVVQGAEPLFFLDYYATGKLDVDCATRVVTGIAKGCSISNCALVGGETAEMPGMYQKSDYDLAGFCVGVVEEDKIIDGSLVKKSDQIIGIASSGPHSNGYSLIRHIIQQNNIDLQTATLPSGTSLADSLLEPTAIYVKPLLSLLEKVNIHAMAHITGGGFWENIPRVLPDNLAAIIKDNSWQWPEVFEYLMTQGKIEKYEMYRTFNCGIGMIVIVDQNDLQASLDHLHSLGLKAWHLGEVDEKSKYNNKQVIIH